MTWNPSRRTFPLHVGLLKTCLLNLTSLVTQKPPCLGGSSPWSWSRDPLLFPRDSGWHYNPNPSREPTTLRHTSSVDTPLFIPGKLHESRRKDSLDRNGKTLQKCTVARWPNRHDDLVKTAHSFFLDVFIPGVGRILWTPLMVFGAKLASFLPPQINTAGTREPRGWILTLQVTSCGTLGLRFPICTMGRIAATYLTGCGED